MDNDNKIIQRSKKVDLDYPHLGEFDRIEFFALQEYNAGEKEIHVKNITLNDSQKKMFERTGELNSSFLQIHTLYEMYINDYAEFIKTFNNYEKKIPKPKKLEENFHSEDNFNRYLVHILSSAILFVTYFENKIKRIYGESSNEYKQWKIELGKIYDQEFSYRFCYHLRNYTQHEGSAIATITTSLGNKNPEKQITCILEIDPQRLINTTYRWKKEIADELKNITENINVNDLLNSFCNSIVSIFSIQNSLFLEHNHEELTELRKKHQKLYPENKFPYIAETNKHDLKKGVFKTFKPLSSINEINQIYFKLSKIGLVKIINNN